MWRKLGLNITTTESAERKDAAQNADICKIMNPKDATLHNEYSQINSNVVFFEIANNMYEIYFLQKRYLVLWWGIVYFI